MLSIIRKALVSAIVTILVTAVIDAMLSPARLKVKDTASPRLRRANRRTS